MQKDTYNINWDNNLIHNVIIGQMKDLNVNFIGQLPSRNITVIFALEKKWSKNFYERPHQRDATKMPVPSPRSRTQV